MEILIVFIIFLSQTINQKMKNLIIFSLLLLSVSASAQLTVEIAPASMSHMVHKADFRSSNALYNLYRTIALTHPNGYSFEQFMQDFELSQKINSFQYGIGVNYVDRKFPVYVGAGLFSSPSDFHNLAYFIKAGIGKRRVLGLYSRFVIDGGVGFMYVKDYGFGRNTIVNSIGNDIIRQNVDAFFVDTQSSDKNTAMMLNSNVYFAYNLSYRMSAGMYGMFAVDLTDSLKRTMRMNFLSFGLKIGFVL